MVPIRLKAVVVLSIFCALAVSAETGRTADVRAIQTAFSNYRDALLQGDGAKAADIMSARTIAYYDGIRTHALSTPRAKLAELDFISRFMILRLRHEFTRTQLSQTTGRELFITGVERGWISKSSVLDLVRLVNIKVVSSKASVAVAQAPGIPAFHFLKESGQWKFDLAASFHLANSTMTQDIAKSGMTEDQFIIRALGLLSSRNVDERVFSPPPE